MVGGEVHEPVLVRPLSAVLTRFVIVVETVSFFQQTEVNEEADVADNRPARYPSGIGDGLIAGEALIGLSIAVGEDDRKRSPGRGSDQRQVALGQLLKDDQRILFLLAGLGLWRGTIGPA